MKYLIALEQKGVSPSQLPKRIQEKINQMGRLNKKLSVFEGVELSEEETEKFKEIKDSIEEIDEFVADKINSFNIDVYNERMAHFNKTIKKKPIESTVQEQEQTAPPLIVTEPVVSAEVINENVGEEVIAEPVNMDNVSSDNVAEDGIELSEEVRDYEKASDAKPTNLSFWFVVGGVGAALLILAIVNVVNSKKRQREG